MSLLTAAGLSDNVATATLRIEEVCAHQDAHLEAFMADFWSIADDLDQRQPSMSASFASINDDDDDDKDADIHIVLSIDNTNIKFEDITIVLNPPPPLPFTSAVVPFLGGECLLSTPNLPLAFESATAPPQKMACQLKQPRHRPCCRNQPRAPNHSDEAIPFHPQPMMGGLLCRQQLFQLLFESHPSSPYVFRGCDIVYDRGGLPAVVAIPESAAVMLHWMAHQCKRLRCRPGHRNVPRAPNLADEAIPFHPLPMMGGTSMPTTTDTKSARANDQDPCSPMSSTSPPAMTLPSPTLQPFTIKGGTSTYPGGDSMIPSMTMASFFHRGSVHDQSTVLVVLANDMALGPSIHWIIFFVVGIIGLGPLINLLDGLLLK